MKLIPIELMLLCSQQISRDRRTTVLDKDFHDEEKWSMVLRRGEREREASGLRLL